MSRVFAGSFVFFIHLALTVYVNSSFLDGYFSETMTSIMFTIGSVITIIGLALLPQTLRRLGARRTLYVGMVVATACLVGLALVNATWLIGVLFSLYFASQTLVLFGIDIFIEDLAPKRTMGTTRGIFLTLKHIALMLVPLATGIIIEAYGFSAMYGLAAVSVMASLLLFTTIKQFKEPSYYTQSVFSTIKQFRHTPALRIAFMATLMQRYFVSAMVMYVPLYLVQHIGLSWSAMGTLISIMLLAFVLLDYPIGRLADNAKLVPWIATLGVLIIAASVASIAFVTTTTFWVWAVILFMTRVGASMVEVMVESFFFKHVEQENIPAIGLFRDTVPAAYILASLFGAVIITLVGIPYIFIGVGLVMLYSIRYTTQLYIATSHD